MEFKDLIKKVLRYHKEADIELLQKAYDFSYDLLKDKTSASGAPLLNHYLDVAYEVADLKLDDKSIAAALLHGLLNKGANLYAIKRLFGDELLDLLENIEKIDAIKKNVLKNKIDPESLRKVLLAASKDIRVLLIKICHKLVSLRNLTFLPVLERKRIAKEALELYAPLAYRLGMGKIKSEMEDLAFREVDEKNYKAVEEKVNKIRADGEKILYKIKKIIEQALTKENIPPSVQARVKHLYSIYKKTVDRFYDLNDMTDIVALRVIVPTLDDCYKTLRIVHAKFRPIPNKFKDYIAMPKPNGYQSLHTSVVDELGHIFEIQIRTQEMHDIAEEGIAAHFSYKKMNHEQDFDKKLNWLKELVEAKDGTSGFDVDFFGNDVFAFTPKGKVIELPLGSTVIDFAYSIHSDLGEHCIGATVNGKFLSLKETIDNGDVIEILTAKTQKPSREWLKFTRTLKARNKIKQTLKEAGTITPKNYYVNVDHKKEVGEFLLKFEGDKKLKPKLALCCKPLPGDDVLGIRTTAFRLMIHKEDCGTIKKADKKRVHASWVEHFEKPVGIIIEGKERPGLLKEILNTVARLQITVTKAKGKMINDVTFECTFSAQVYDLTPLTNLIERIYKIKDVKKVYVTV